MPKPRRVDALTPREEDVLGLLREGLTNEQIADRLGISFETAKHHVGAILSKLNVATREEAAAWQPTAEPSRWTLARALLAFAGTAVAAAAVAGLALLAWGVSQAGEDLPADLILQHAIYLPPADHALRLAPESRLADSGIEIVDSAAEFQARDDAHILIIDLDRWDEVDIEWIRARTIDGGAVLVGARIDYEDLLHELRPYLQPAEATDPTRITYSTYHECNAPEGGGYGGGSDYLDRNFEEHYRAFLRRLQSDADNIAACRS